MEKPIFVITGPAASGKSTIFYELKKNLPFLERVITFTTREKRPGEIDRADYYFLSREDFEEKIKQKKFFEYAEVHGNYYGNAFGEVERIRSKNQIPLFIVDYQGAIKIKTSFPESIVIFLDAGSLDGLKKRLEKRGDSPEKIEIRLKTAKDELKYLDKFDYTVRNLDGCLKEAVEEVQRIILEKINS